MSDVRERWVLRALAVAIAVGIWLPASFCPRLREMTTPPIEERIEARVTIPDDEQMIVLDELDSVSVRIRGTEDLIGSLARDQIRVQVPLGETVFDGTSYGGPRTIEVVLSAEDVVRPEGIEVVSLEPDRLSLNVDEEISRSVPVRADFVGEPIGVVRLDRDNVVIAPPTVIVRGARSEINMEQRAVAGPVDIGGRGVPFDIEVRVRFESPHVQVVTPTHVTLTVPLVSDLDPEASSGP